MQAALCFRQPVGPGMVEMDLHHDEDAIWATRRLVTYSFKRWRGPFLARLYMFLLALELENALQTWPKRGQTEAFAQVTLPRTPLEKAYAGRPPVCRCGLHAGTARLRLGRAWRMPVAPGTGPALAFGDGPELPRLLKQQGYEPVVAVGALRC